MGAMRSFVVKRAHAKGQAIIEMIFSVIMFTLMLVSIASISAYLYVQHTMVTAAREGARIASLNTDLGSGMGGEAEVQEHVIELVQSTSGITLSADDIDVTPPDPGGAVGERSVTVEIDYAMPNPLPLEAMLSGFAHREFGLDNIPVRASATMRYEE